MTTTKGPIDAILGFGFLGQAETQGDATTNLFIDPVQPQSGLRAVRSQADNLGLLYSEITRSENHEESLTRQEHKEEADINFLLERFGMNPAREVVYNTVVDYSLDLTQAMDTMNAVKNLANQVPPELRRKYPTSRDVLAATETGEYAHDLALLAADKLKKAAEAKELEDFKAAKQTPKDPPKDDGKGVS